MRALVVSLTATVLLACINIGSTAALNAIISLGVVALLTSYALTIGCVALRRWRGPPLPPRRWSLGRAGAAVNVAALLFLAPMWFFSFWPVTTPTKPGNMNWAVAMYGGIITIAVVFYVFKARHVYVGPVVETKRNL